MPRSYFGSALSQRFLMECPQSDHYGYNIWCDLKKMYSFWTEIGNYSQYFVYNKPALIVSNNILMQIFFRDEQLHVHVLGV